MFRQFLKEQGITHNLDFWLACERYHQWTPDYQEDVATAIYAKYIAWTAPQKVQIKPNTKRAIKNTLGLRLMTVPPSLFKLAQDEVWELMERNELQQFLASDMCREVFSDIEDSMNMERAFSSASPDLHGASPMLHWPSISSGLQLPYRRSQSMYSLDSDTKSYRRVGRPAKKDKPVSKEDFVAMVCEGLVAVKKDRDQMQRYVQNQGRLQGNSYEEILSADWYDHPASIKYDGVQ
jgi:hypothetical protein